LNPGKQSTPQCTRRRRRRKSPINYCKHHQYKEKLVLVSSLKKTWSFKKPFLEEELKAMVVYNNQFSIHTNYYL